MAKKQVRSHNQDELDSSPALPDTLAEELCINVREWEAEKFFEFLQSQGAANMSLPAGESDPAPAQFPLRGTPPLALPQGLRSLSVPDDLRQHPLLLGKCYYTLPPQLLEAIEKYGNAVTANNELWAMEKRLAEICGDHTQRVGFVRGQALPFDLLRSQQPLIATAQQKQEFEWEGFNEAKLAFALRTYDERTRWSNTIARAYAGWLNCNVAFHSERDEVLTSGLQVISITPNMLADAAGEKLPEGARDFLVRWRLMGMAGRRLPIPMRPMLAGQFPLSIIQQLMAAGGLFNLPDTYPIPSRDELRGILEDAVRSNRPEHLQEWMQITSKQNPAKNKIDRFARLFELQHYWELLFERHRDAAKGQVVKLQRALAAFLQTSDDTIKNDLRFLRGRLGKAWPG